MSTEEEIIEYATVAAEELYYTDSNDQSISDSMRAAYIAGASLVSSVLSAQHTIELENAWKLFEKHATYIHPRKGIEACKMTKQQFMEQVDYKNDVL